MGHGHFLSRIAMVAAPVAVFAAAAAGQPTIANPDFSAGNTGFTSDYAFSTVNSGNGQYTVTSTPRAFNPAFVNPPGANLMLVVNGASNPGPGSWRAWAQTVVVQPGDMCEVSCRAASAVSGQGTRLRWAVNGQVKSPEVLLPAMAGVWTSVTGSFVLFFGRTQANLSIECVSDSGQPNGFYVDDLTIHVIGVVDCNGADFNGDGDVGTDQDIEAFFRCLAGSCCPTCAPSGADFNGDGDVGTDADIEDFFRTLAGGGC